jgi:glycosyltransferase involved in cell wall biosynthesis
MKLLYINKIETTAGWGLETFLNQSLIENEIETICVDYQKNAYALSKNILDITENFDAVLLERGCGYLIPLEILKAIKRPKILLFTELVARNVNQHYLLKSGIFEHIFFRSFPCMEWVANKGWLNQHQMSLFLSAIDPNFHKPIEGITKDIDILFVGTLLPRRQKIISELSDSFSVTTCSAFGEDMVNLINRAKIVLNIHGEDFLDTETRVYETLACKGFLLTETLSSENPFQDGVHLVETKNIEDLKEKIAYYLDNPIKRETIAEAGYQEVIQHHTFKERAEQIQQVIVSYLPSLIPANDPIVKRRLQILKILENSLQFRDATFFQARRILSYYKQSLSKKINYHKR